MKRTMTAIAIALTMTACSGSNVTGPSNSIPDVAGTYRGTTTFSYPELGRSLSCPSSTSVAQTGGHVSIAPVQLGGECASSGVGSIPIGDMQIDTTGSLGSGTMTIPIGNCTYTATASGGFFGKSLQASLSYVSRSCYNMNVTFNLSR